MASPGAENPGAEPSLIDGVVQLSFAVHEILGGIASEHDLSLTQVRMLGVLRDREPTMLELARFLSLEKSSVTGLVDRAERRGLVSRSRGRGDGREIHVRLTTDGRRLAARFVDRVDEHLGTLLAALGGRERTQLARVANRLVEQYADDRGIDLGAGRV